MLIAGMTMRVGERGPGVGTGNAAGFERDTVMGWDPEAMKLL